MKEDYQSYVHQAATLLQEFDQKKLLITGATGFLGSLTSKIFLVAKELGIANCQLFLQVRSIEKLNRVFEGYSLEGVTILEGSVESLDPSLLPPLTYILHTAAPTSSKDFIQKPVQVIQTILNGTQTVLELGRHHSTSIKKILCLSSLEVYGQTDPSQNPIKENQSGYLDWTQVRSSYSEGKRMAECLASAYHSQYQVPVVSGRLTQTFGPEIDYHDNRVFAQFARAVVEGRDILLATKGETCRAYCYSLDAIDAILRLLVWGQSGQAYNISNPQTYCSILEMAQLVTSIFGNGQSSVQIQLQDNATTGYNPIVQIDLDVSKLQSLGWTPSLSLEEMFERLIHSFRQQKEIS